MTDIDIVDELRRLYEAATGDDTRPWSRMEKHDRVLGHPIYHGDPLNEGVGVAFTLRAADLIVAMHNHLPALLDAVEAWRAHEAHMARRDIDDAPDEDSWLAEWEVLNDRACTALEALGRSDAG